MGTKPIPLPPSISLDSFESKPNPPKRALIFIFEQTDDQILKEISKLKIDKLLNDGYEKENIRLFTAKEQDLEDQFLGHNLEKTTSFPSEYLRDSIGWVKEAKNGLIDPSIHTFGKEGAERLAKVLLAHGLKDPDNGLLQVPYTACEAIKTKEAHRFYETLQKGGAGSIIGEAMIHIRATIDSEPKTTKKELLQEIKEEKIELAKLKESLTIDGKLNEAAKMMLKEVEDSIIQKERNIEYLLAEKGEQFASYKDHELLDRYCNINEPARSLDNNGKMKFTTDFLIPPKQKSLWSTMLSGTIITKDPKKLESFRKQYGKQKTETLNSSPRTLKKVETKTGSSSTQKPLTRKSSRQNIG